jgi:hypothetical protein
MTTAMQSLHDRWGLSTSDIARALHTNANVIRHWRNGVEPNSDEVARADLLDRFLTDVHDRGVTEPAAWMSVPLVEGYTVTRWHLYIASCSLGLLRENAAGSLSDLDLLYEFNPDWRRTYWTSFKTVEAADGGLSVVGKSYDDVRAQIPEGVR